MYNTYQNRVAVARESYTRAVQDFDNAITEARLQNNSALAEIAYKTLQQILELSLQGFQYKNSLVLDRFNQKQNLENNYYMRWQDVLKQINTENALAEEIRRFNFANGLGEFAAADSGGGGGGWSGGGSGGGGGNPKSAPKVDKDKGNNAGFVPNDGVYVNQPPFYQLPGLKPPASNGAQSINDKYKNNQGKIPGGAKPQAAKNVPYAQLKNY